MEEDRVKLLASKLAEAERLEQESRPQEQEAWQALLKQLLKSPQDLRKALCQEEQAWYEVWQLSGSSEAEAKMLEAGARRRALWELYLAARRFGYSE